MTGTSATRLAGGQVVTPEGTIEALDVIVAGGTIVALEPRSNPGAESTEIRSTSTGGPESDFRRFGSGDVVDVSGRLLAPGYIDLQLNGGWGCDFTSDPNSIGHVARELPAIGVTAFVPTIVTAPPAARWSALAAFAAVDAAPGAATAIGLHFEGPAISPERAGAHDLNWIGRPGDDEIAAWRHDAGVVMVTVAPEVDGALELIEALVAAGVVVSAGHSRCTAEELAAARRAGVSMVTHLFNAMGPFSHRSPGIVGAALAGDVYAGLICDGIHVDPVAVEVAWRALGRDRLILVSDAISALGLAVTETRLGGVSVTIDETGVRTAEGVLAGSNLALDAAVRNLVSFTGCEPAEAIRTVTLNPAEALGLADRGRVEVGARADLVVLDEDLQIELTMIGGEVAWRS